MKPFSILVVAHDAAGAEIVSAWVKRNQENDFLYCLDGPAKSIFEKKIGMVENISIDGVESDQLGISRIIAGSGWGSDLEKRAIAYGEDAGISTVMQLDHWIRYPERFKYKSRTIEPDEVWVGDDYAAEIMRKTAVGLGIRSQVLLKPNYYFEDEVDSIRAFSSSKITSRYQVLYLSEPIEETVKIIGTNPFGYTEFEALSGFLNFLRQNPNRLRKSTLVRIRPHPAEMAGKYEKFVSDFNSGPEFFKLELSPRPPLSEEISWADWIIGMDSTAMAIAALAGKKVACAIPPTGEPPVIPFGEIERLFESRHG